MQTEGHPQLGRESRGAGLWIAVLVFEIAEIGRQRGAAGVEGGHADEGAGERAVLAAPALVRDHAGIEHRPDRQPAAAGAVEELQLGAVDLGGEPDRRIAGRAIGSASGNVSLPSGQSPGQDMIVSTRPRCSS